MKYMVGVKIYNCFEVEADSEEEAEIQIDPETGEPQM